jgi:hypothetical protein
MAETFKNMSNDYIDLMTAHPGSNKHRAPTIAVAAAQLDHWVNQKQLPDSKDTWMADPTASSPECSEDEDEDDHPCSRQQNKGEVEQISNQRIANVLFGATSAHRFQPIHTSLPTKLQRSQRTAAKRIRFEQESDKTRSQREQENNRVFNQERSNTHQPGHQKYLNVRRSDLGI